MKFLKLFKKANIVNTFHKAIAAMGCLVLSASAHADIYKADFTFSNFHWYTYILGSSTVPPQNVVTGSITYEAASMYGTPTAVNAVDLTVVGHTYGISEVVFAPEQKAAFGGAPYGIATSFDTNDFFLRLASDSAGASTGSFYYSTAGIDTIFVSNSAVVTISDLGSAVPEPGSLALLFAGAMGLGFAGRRDKKSSK